MKNTIVCVASLLISATTLSAAGYRAGLSRMDITPQGPIWMSGYASRTHPSEGVLQPLYAKALAIEDSKHAQVVIVTTDLIGLPHVITDAVSARVQKEHGLDRSRLLFNSSHTHTGPVVGSNLATMYALDPENDRNVKEYARKLTEDLVQLITAALADLKPAEVSYGLGDAGFAMNRRQFTPTGVKIGVNPEGPTDHTVPVIRIANPDGTLRAVLFAYACHNTTLTGEFYKLSADYAGFAQAEVEKAHPGVTALFMMLCGADQNPNPRSTLELAEAHGKELAQAVNRVLDGKLEKLEGPIRTAFLLTELALSPHTRDTFEAMRNDKNPSKVRLAQTMLKAYDERHPVRTVQYPVQAIRFGKDHTILALGGEVVVGYDLRAKKEFSRQKLIVAGYSNDVMCYIPTAKILQEGGYEAVDSMVYYGQPTPFTPDVEESIFQAIHKVMKRVGLQ